MGCTSQKIPDEPVYIYETVTLFQDRYIRIPDEAVKPVNIYYPATKDFDTIDLRIMYEEQREAAKLCNGKLKSIAGMRGTIPE